jgi:hypothetical protein
MSDAQPETGSEDKYAVLGLTVVSRHAAKGLNEVIRIFQVGLKKVRIAQLFIVVALLFFLSTDMLPFPAVMLSGAVVFVAVVILGKRLFSTAISEATEILKAAELGQDREFLKEAITEPAAIKELVHTGVFIVHGDDVINVDGDEIVICKKDVESV